MVIVMMWRDVCSDCGSRDLVWLSCQSLLKRVHPSMRLRVREALDFVGSDGNAWRCRDCETWGVYSSPVFDFPA